MDRNQATGLILMSILLLLYFSFFGGQTEAPQKEETTTEQVEPPTTNNQPATNLDTVEPSASINASIDAPAQTEDTLLVPQAIEEIIEIENENLKITFSTIGGKIKEVILKDYVTYSKEPLILLDEQSSQTSLIANNAGREIDLMQQSYEVSKSSKTDTTIVTFTMTNSSGGTFQQIYEIPDAGYMINYSIRASGMDYLLGSDLSYNWKNDLKSFEKDNILSRTKTSVNYYTLDGSFEELGERSADLETAEAGEFKWLNFKQQFFSTAIIANNKFNRLSASQEVMEQYVNIDKFTTASIGIPVDDIKLGQSDFKFFFGPNSYPLLKKVTPDFQKNVYLGWPPVNLVNKWIIIPIFNWLKNYIANFGINPALFRM